MDSDGRLIKYWEEEGFDAEEWKWSEDFDESGASLLEKWEDAKDDIIAESKDHRGKVYVKNFETCVEKDMKEKHLLPLEEEFAQKSVGDDLEIDDEYIDSLVQKGVNPYELYEQIGRGDRYSAQYFKKESVILTKDSEYGKKGEMIEIADAKELFAKELARRPKRSEIF